MSELIEHSGSDSHKVLSIGSEQSPVSIKIYQDIYHQITGRTEQISQKYTENVLLDFSEIEQLHYKIMQLCDVHTVIASNEVVTVFHEKERKEQFTSFERFKAYNSNATKPTVSVVLRYNFSILLSDRKQPQEYIVTIRLASRVAILNAMEGEVPPFMRGRFLGLSRLHTAEISVEYVDYVVARSFLEAFDEWIQGCSSEPKSKYIDFFQSVSHYVPQILQLIMPLIVMYFCLQAAPSFLANTAPLDWGRFFIIFSSAFYIVFIISGILGRFIEYAVDSIQQVSYLKLNKGDEKLIRNFSKRNRRTFIRFFAGCILTVLLGVASSLLSGLV